MKFVMRSAVICTILAQASVSAAETPRPQIMHSPLPAYCEPPPARPITPKLGCAVIDADVVLTSDVAGTDAKKRQAQMTWAKKTLDYFRLPLSVPCRSRLEIEEDYYSTIVTFVISNEDFISLQAVAGEVFGSQRKLMELSSTGLFKTAEIWFSVVSDQEEAGHRGCSREENRVPGKCDPWYLQAWNDRIAREHQEALIRKNCPPQWENPFNQ